MRRFDKKKNMNKANILAERRYLKEDFADDVIAQAFENDPQKPQPRKDLVGLIFDDVPNKKVIYAVEFISERPYEAYNNAKAWLQDMGYTIGNMQRDKPIGFMKDVEYISKWTKMTDEEHQMLDGIIISPVFSAGLIVVLFYTPPNF